MKKRFHGKKHTYAMRNHDGEPILVHSAMTMGEGYYSGPDPRRRQEMEDSGMIYEDHRSIANLPQDVKYHEWPHAMYAQYPNLDDSARGIDKQIDTDLHGMMREQKGKKY